MRRLFDSLDTPLGRASRYIFSTLLIAVLVGQLDWKAIAQLRGQWAGGPVILGTLVAGVTFPLHAWRWWLLLRAQGLALSLPWAHAVTWIGNFYNAFLLGGLGGDTARTYYVCRDAPEYKAAGLAATLLDRILGLFVLLSIAAVALVLQLDALAHHPEFRRLLYFCTTLSFLGVVAGFVFCHRPPAWLARRIGETHTATLTSTLAHLQSKTLTLLTAMAASYAIWLLDFVAVWLLAQAVHLPLRFIDVTLAMSVAYASTILPISVGGHGIREGALLATLTALGALATPAAQEQGLLLALLVWLSTIFWSLFGGLFSLAAPHLIPASKIQQ